MKQQQTGHAVDAEKIESLSTQRAQPISLSEMQIGSHKPLKPDGKPLTAGELNPLHQVKTTLQVCLGHATVTVGELLGARTEQVLQLDRTIQQPVDLLLEGQVVARGQLVAVGEHFAVRITELPIALGMNTPGTP